MATSAMDRVREAELQAEEILRKGAADAERLADDAHNEALRKAKAAIEAAQLAQAQRIADAHKESQLILEANASVLEGQLEQLAASAREKQPAAIQKILEML